MSQDEARAEAESWLRRLDGDSHWARSPEQRERIDHERGILRALLNGLASRKPEAAPPVKAFDTSREPVKNGAVSLHVEAAPSDTDREALHEELEQVLYPWLELDARSNAAYAILTWMDSRPSHAVQVARCERCRTLLKRDGAKQ